MNYRHYTNTMLLSVLYTHYNKTSYECNRYLNWMSWEKTYANKIYWTRFTCNNEGIRLDRIPVTKHTVRYRGTIGRSWSNKVAHIALFNHLIFTRFAYWRDPFIRLFFLLARTTQMFYVASNQYSRFILSLLSITALTVTRDKNKYVVIWTSINSKLMLSKPRKFRHMSLI